MVEDASINSLTNCFWLFDLVCHNLLKVGHLHPSFFWWFSGSAYPKNPLSACCPSSVIEKSEQLVRDSIIAVPPQMWSITCADDDKANVNSDEDKIVLRLGFIFVAYRCDFKPQHSSTCFCLHYPGTPTSLWNNLHRVDCWWWESVEMLRKFLMT